MLCLGLAGCASYAPVQVDQKTGMYSTTTELDKSAIREYDTTVDLQAFRFVYLNANSNVYPGRFEFFVRNALADLGVTQVLNQDELVAFVKAHPKLKDVSSVNDPLAIKKVSEAVGPILMVEFNSIWDGDVRRYVTLKITDASTGRKLLHVEQDKLIWMSVDPEAHYPVLNVLRQWVKACSNKKSA